MASSSPSFSWRDCVGAAQHSIKKSSRPSHVHRASPLRKGYCPGRKNRGMRKRGFAGGSQRKRGEVNMSVAAPSYDSKIDIGGSVRGAYTVVMENARLSSS